MLNEGKRAIHGKLTLDDLKLTIEVPAGGKRSGVSKRGDAWEQTVTAAYGYILGTHSPDGMHLDCWVRRNPKRGADVFVVHQLTPDGSRYDEDKVMLGYASKAEAVRDFKANCFKPSVMVGGVSEFGMEHFKVVAWSASNSKAMLSSQAEYDRFKKEGLLPAGIRSPIQVAQKVSESMDINNSPLISYPEMDISAAAFDLARKNGLSAQRDGYRVYFEDPDDLETFIDIVDHHQLPKTLLGDLQDALPENETVELPEDTIDESLGSFPTYRIAHVPAPLAGTIKSAGLDLVGYDFVDRGMILVIRGRVDIHKMAQLLGVDVYDVSLFDGAERSGNPEDAQYTEVHVHEEHDEDVEESNTDDVFFQQQIQEMRQLAGVKDDILSPVGTPIVHTTKAIVESINDGFRNTIRESYVRHASARRVSLMVENEQLDKALRLCVMTQAAYPQESVRRIQEAVAQKVFGSPTESANIARYISEQTGMAAEAFVPMFAEQEVDEKFNKPAHDWVRKRAGELYPKHVKDKAAAYARAWVEFKQK